MKNLLSKVIGFALLGVLCGCASESYKALEVKKPVAAETAYAGRRVPVVLGNFNNNSGYMQGLFSDGVDRLGDQARTILEGYLRTSNRFAVYNRTEMETLAREARITGEQQRIGGAQFSVTGAVTEFGRKTTGDVQLFGIAGKGKQQIAYAKVTLNVVNVATSEIVYSAAGAGEYELSNREVIGFGGTSGYDATLNGKVLDLAIREAIDRLAEGVDSGQILAR